MLRPVRIQTYPGNQWYANFRRSTDGALYYPGAGVIVAVPSYESQLEAIDSMDPGLRSMNYCAHYRVIRSHKADELNENLWVNLNDHNSGQWVPIGRSNPAQWIWDEGYGGGWLHSSNGYGPKQLYGGWSDPVKDLPALANYDRQNSILNIVSQPDIEELQKAALRAMLPGIRPANNLSLLNSIYELKDYRQLASRTQDLIRRIRQYPLRNTRLFYNRKLVRFWSGLETQIANKPLSWAVRTYAGQYLNWYFNLKPLLQDICSVQKALSDLRDQFRKLKASSNKPLLRHFRRELVNTYRNEADFRTLVTTNALVDPNFSCGRVVNYVIRQFNATLEFSYKLNINEGDSDLPWALLDGLGVNLNPRIIWAAIPWSFVVDWVIGVGRYLENFKTRNIEPTVNITNYCNSTHVRRVITTSGGFSGNSTLFELTEDAYLRVPGLPNAYRSISLSGLSPMEFSLGAALAVTR